MRSKFIFMLFCFSPVLLIANPSQAQTPAPAANAQINKTNPAVVAKDMDSDPDQCVIDDGTNDDPPWEVFESAIPACKRAMVSLDPGAKLDLGAKAVMKNYPNGMNTLKVTVVSGKGTYDNDQDTAVDLSGVTLWVSLDRCQLRDISLRNVHDRDVDDLKKARIILTNQESVSGITNGDGLKNYKDDCQAPAPVKNGKNPTAPKAH
jgi:hypothetical protein